jgi:hypothetical protein
MAAAAVDCRGAGGLALLIGWRLRAPRPSCRAGAPGRFGDAVGACCAGSVAAVAAGHHDRELSSQQNIIAVVVDDSRSMNIADSDGKTREAAALAALEGWRVLAGLQKRFQTRIYRLAAQLTRWTDQRWTQPISPMEAATHIGDGLKQLVAETSDLPVGAVVLLSDGAKTRPAWAAPGISARRACRRCGIAGCRCTPSASARRNTRTMWRLKT